MIIMMIFDMSTSYSHKFSFQYFWGLFNDETDFRVRYLRTWCPHHALFARDGRNIKRSVVSFGSLYCLLPPGKIPCQVVIFIMIFKGTQRHWSGLLRPLVWSELGQPQHFPPISDLLISWSRNSQLLFEVLLSWKNT
jgi:hypothetical protein